MGRAISFSDRMVWYPLPV